VCIRGSIFFPVPLASWIPAGQFKRSRTGTEIFFADRTLYTEIIGNGSAIDACPLIAGTYFYISVVFNACHPWVKNIVVKNILCIGWFGLAYPGEANELNNYNNNNGFHTSSFSVGCVF
jgi:hypothetical protein